jgi:hypothetical protein
MLKRCLLAMLLAVGFASFAQAAPPKPAIEVRLKAISDMAPIVKYVGGLMQQEDAGAQYAGIIEALAKEENGFDGVDMSKPLGAYIGLADAVEDSPVVVLLPIKNEKAALAALKDKLGLDPKKDGDLYSVDVPNVPGPVYFRFKNDYAYLTIRSAKSIDAEKLIKPIDFFTDNVSPLLGVKVHLTEWPADLKKTLLGQVEMQWNEYLRNLEPSAVQKLMNSFLVDVGVDALKTVLADGETLSVKLDAVPKTDDVKLSIRLGAKSGSTLAKTLDGFAAREVMSANALQGAAQLGLQFRTPPETTKKLVKLADDLLAEGTKNAPEATQLGAKMVVESLKPMLQSGDIQLGVGLPLGTEKAPNVVAWLKMDEGEKFRRVVQMAGVGLTANGTAKAEYMKVKVADYYLHRMEFTQTPTKAMDLSPLWMATSDNSAIFHTGEKERLLKTWAKEAKPVAMPMLSLKLEAVPLMRLATSTLPEEDFYAKMKEHFGGEPKGKDTVELTAQGGKEFQLDLSIKGKVIAIVSLSTKTEK